MSAKVACVWKVALGKTFTIGVKRLLKRWMIEEWRRSNDEKDAESFTSAKVACLWKVVLGETFTIGVKRLLKRMDDGGE